MSKPYIHALSSAKAFGGQPEDYIEIHNFLDSSKGTIADNRHRALTHTSWFLITILERIKFQNSNEAPNGIFATITNSDGKRVSVRDVGEQHILEDYHGKFLPTAQDFLENMESKPWMQNGEKGYPNSIRWVLDKPKEPAEVIKDMINTLPGDLTWPTSDYETIVVD